MDNRNGRAGFARGSALAVALSLAVIGCGKGEKEEAPEATVQAAPAARAEISRLVKAEAVIFPIEQSAIAPRINAPVRKVYVTLGQKVRQSQAQVTAA